MTFVPFAALRRRLALLTSGERLWWLSCFPLGLLTASLETVGGVLIFALTAALLNSTTGGGATQTALTAALHTFGVPANAVALTVLTAVVYIIKNVVLLAAIYYRSRVTTRIGAGLSSRITRAYVTAPYTFHLGRNSAETAQNILDGVPGLVRLFEAVVTLATEVLVVAGLTVLLMRVAFLETLVAASIIGLMVGTFVRFTRDRYRSLGERHYTLSTNVLRALQQALGGMKEVAVFGRERHFADAISRDDAGRMRVAVVHASLESVPRLITESAFVLGLVGLIVALEMRTGSIAAVMPFIGLYAYVGFRLIPAGHRIAYQAGSMRYDAAATETLCRDLDQLAAVARERVADVTAPASAMHFRDQLNVEQVSYSYDRSDRPVLDGITLNVRCGECVAIVGATGAGKTTLVDIIMGLLTPAAGRVTVDGTPIAANVREWRRQVGYVPQTPFLLDDTLRRNIAFGVDDADIDDAAVAAAVRVAQLQEFVDGLAGGLDTTLGERGVRLSGGERQRVSIARALYGDPDLLVLDEATSSLDPGTERALTQAIDQLKGRKTLLVIAHRLSTVEHADRVVVLKNGRVDTMGTFAELARDSDAFRDLAALDQP